MASLNEPLSSTYNAPRGRETQENGVSGEDHSYEVLWLLVHRLQIDLLASRPRNHGAELEPDEETAEGQDEAEDPEHQRSADRPYGS